jgi:4-amino-4-deoxy-L-arabinose transferase-like glycosyltransferase
LRPVLAGAAVFALAVASAAFWGSGAPQGADAADYRRLAENLLQGHGFTLSASPPYEPSARRAPAYPVFLAAVYAVAGRTAGTVLGAQALLWGLGCLALAGLVGRAGSPIAGWTAGALVAVHPVLARAAGEVLTECFYTVTLIGVVAALDQAVRRRSGVWLALAGGLTGAAVLTRPLTLALLPLLWGGLLLWRGALDAPWRSAAVLTAVALAVLLPWTIRNAVVFGRFIPVQAQGLGVNVWLATLPYHEQPIGGWTEAGARLRARYPEMGRDDEASPTEPETVRQLARQRVLLRAGLARILADPAAYLQSRLRAYPHLWLHSGGGRWLGEVSFGDAWRRGEGLRLAAKAAYVLVFSVMPLGLAAALLVRQGLPREHVWLWVVPIFIALGHLPLWIEYRFSLPAQPFVWGLAVLGAGSWRAGGRHRPPRAQRGRCR